MKLALSELANLLNISDKAIERWIRQGRIPVKKIGAVCAFKRSDLEKWALKHRLSLVLPTESEKKIQAQSELVLYDAMAYGGVNLIKSADMESSLEAACQFVPDLAPSYRSALFDSLKARESMTSTGIGNGVAIPHPRTPLSDVVNTNSITTCFLQDPIEYNAIDDQPVYVLFLLVSQSVKSHLQLLSRLSFCLRNKSFSAFLKTKPDAESFLAQIKQLELEVESGKQK